MPTPLRAMAETMPLVTGWPTPKGSPMASTRSPIWASSRDARGRTGSFSAPTSIFRTAMSARGSASSTLAGSSRRSLSTTMISWPPAMTWLLVTITPSARTMTPEPRDWAMRSRGTPWPPPNISQNGSTAWRTTRRL